MHVVSMIQTTQEFLNHDFEQSRIFAKYKHIYTIQVFTSVIIQLYLYTRVMLSVGTLQP